MMWWRYASSLPIPSGPTESFTGQPTFGSSTITGPGSWSRSSACSTIRSDSRISAIRTRYRAYESASVRTGTSKS